MNPRHQIRSGLLAFLKNSHQLEKVVTTAFPVSETQVKFHKVPRVLFHTLKYYILRSAESTGLCNKLIPMLLKMPC